MKTPEERKEQRDTRRARGLCASCSEASAPGKSECHRCQSRRLALQRRRRGDVVQVDPVTGESEVACRYDRKHANDARCKCGLRMPCDSCIPTATELASRRLSCA